MTESPETEPFDPYAFALQWCMDHPEVLLEYENRVEWMLDSGLTLDELDEVEANAFDAGKLARESGVSAQKSWERHKRTLPKGVKIEAKESFYRGYIRS